MPKALACLGDSFYTTAYPNAPLCAVAVTGCNWGG